MRNTTRMSIRLYGTHGERGTITVLTAVLMLSFIAIVALVLDFGMIMLCRTELSKAVDAGALAGAQELPNQSSARAFATDYVANNVKDKSTLASTVTFPATNVVRVKSTVTLPAFFAVVLGLNNFNVPAVAEATRFDPNVALIIDRSGSMCEDSHPKAGANCPAGGPWQPFSTIQQIAKGFVDQLNGNPKFTLISYSTTARLDVALTTNRSVIKVAIDALRPGGYTDIAASVDAAIDQLLLSTGPEPKLVILLTDGKTNTVKGRYVGDDSPTAVQALTDVAKKAKNKGIPIYGINYGKDVDNDLMRQIAESTEGHFYYAPNNGSLKVVYGEIADLSHIRLTYVD